MSVVLFCFVLFFFFFTPHGRAHTCRGDLVESENGFVVGILPWCALKRFFNLSMFPSRFKCG